MSSRIFVPATVLAQVWRGGTRSAPLARLQGAIDVDSLNGERAREVGERLGDRGGSDVVDAHVVCCAAEQRATIATSDPDDIRSLARPGERLTLIPV